MSPPISHSFPESIAYSREPLKSVYGLQTIIEEGSTREIIVAHYDNLPTAIQMMIKRSMEIVSHESVTMARAEEIIHPKQLSNVSEGPVEPDEQIEKIHHLFHLAIAYSIENALLPQMEGVNELKEIKRQIDNKINRFAIRDAYENLSPWGECALAQEMRDELMYEEDGPQGDTMGDLRAWAKKRAHREIFRKKYPLTSSNSLFCSAVETLIERYESEWRLDNQSGPSHASLQGSSSPIITD